MLKHKKVLKTIGVVISILLLTRGFVYRQLVNYISVGVRKNIKITNPILINKVNIKSKNGEMTMIEILNIANSITCEELKFTSKIASRDPNQLINLHQANCVGYSAMFNSIANYLIEQNGLEQQIESKHHIGQLTFLEMDIHKYFNSSFFKNHDFNQLTNLETGEDFFIDPSLSDYFWIDSVVSKN